MMGKNLWDKPLAHPRSALTLYWVCWKIALLLVILASPGPGYDSSTTILFAQHDQTVDYRQHGKVCSYLVQRLVRWDAIYFTQAAHRGFRFEQEWAFSRGFSGLLSLGGKRMF